jgi:UPF0176 protein
MIYRSGLQRRIQGIERFDLVHMTISVAAFYQFTTIEDPGEKKGPLLHMCRSQGIRGTIILASEGLNGTIAGPPAGVSAVLEHICEWQEVNNLEVNYSSSTTDSFNRMKVKVKPEIVSMGEPGVDPRSGAGTYVEPGHWNDLISRDDVLVVDTRNHFEIELGRFANAVDPGTVNFHEFPQWAERLAADRGSQKAVAMYCTGGIRCEKATTYMRALGFEQVYHLRGGILKYLEVVPESESLWQGECFVFDDRVSLKHDLRKGEYVLCYACQRPVPPGDMNSCHYEEGVSCARCFDSMTDGDRARFRERQRQVTLSFQRGTSHIRDDAATAFTDAD